MTNLEYLKEADLLSMKYYSEMFKDSDQPFFIYHMHVCDFKFYKN